MIKFSEKARGVAAKVSAMYAAMYAACFCTLTAMATGTGVFDGMQTTVNDVITSAIGMLKSFIIPLATVACLCAIILMYLPGMSSKTTDRCKSVIWACIATVVVAYALGGIFTLAENLGTSIV